MNLNMKRKDGSRYGINWFTDDTGWCYNKVHVHGYSREELERIRDNVAGTDGKVLTADEQVLTDMGDFGRCIRCGYGLYGFYVDMNETEEDEPHIVLTIGKSCD